MLPNRFPDAGEMPEYNTIDATLWYFEAVRSLQEQYQFLHLHLAFPGVFHVPEDFDADSEGPGWAGGFDVVHVRCGLRADSEAGIRRLGCAASHNVAKVIDLRGAKRLGDA